MNLFPSVASLGLKMGLESAQVFLGPQSHVEVFRLNYNSSSTRRGCACKIATKIRARPKNIILFCVALW